MEDKNPIRINKYFSEIGYCSRRAADKLIEEGRVTINGAVAEMGSKVVPGDEIRLNGKIMGQKTDDFVYIAFNKPKGIVCTTDTVREKNNIIDYINYPERIFPIGRLDKDSQGLIFLTNDGDIVNEILRNKNNNEKEYLVVVKDPITPAFIRKMGNGVPILGTMTNKCFVEQIDAHQFRIILTQGLNRQIRRMTEYLGNKVIKLQRYRIMNVNLDVPIGKWRHLTEEEISTIKKSLAGSSKTG
ncbi:MAG TPA: 23S rRNA pseudouridine(2604) synthase RluF [Moheibacter sp.]|nr:23S rRNA pseudouridine(2604) synthase RluF [Moheibacter sp.]